MLRGCHKRLRELNGPGYVLFDCRRNNGRRAYSLGERRPQEQVGLEATQCPLGDPPLRPKRTPNRPRRGAGPKSVSGVCFGG